MLRTFRPRASTPRRAQDKAPFAPLSLGRTSLRAEQRLCPLQHTNPPAQISRQSWQRHIVPSIGFYDGYFDPATGTFFSLSQAVLRGTDLMRATADTKLLNFATNPASLIFSCWAATLFGQPAWP
ncbi:MAG: hypothetical protein Q4A62_03930 [Eikenella sp.]|nr:hypothetical protein [Eikenella sp.]